MEFRDRVDPASTALVVVDMQNDFVRADGACGQVGDDVSDAPLMIERLKKLIASARKAGVFIIFVQTTYDEPVLSPPLAEQYRRRGFLNSICLTGTRGAEFVEGFGPSGAPNETIVRKHRYSAFWGTTIDLMLRSNGIKSLVMTGIATEVFVESTSRNAFFRDYRIVEAGDCVSWLARDRHDASQAVIARSFGMVVPSTEISAVWDEAMPGRRNWQPEVKAANILTTLEQRIAPAHTALVLIDTQNDFCDERGAAGVRGESITMIKRVVPQIQRLLEWARAAGTMVIHVKSENGPYVRHAGSPYRYPSTGTPDRTVWTASAADIDLESEFPPELAEICLPGTWGSAFVDGIEPADDEQVVVKHRFSGFVDTRLDLLLRSNGIRTVLVGGVTTNCSVESTVRDAVMRDYYTVVAEDCVGVEDMQADLHGHSLETMRAHFSLVEPLARIVGAWREAGYLNERAIA